MCTLVTEVIEGQLTHMCLRGFNEGNGAENTVNNNSSFGSIWWSFQWSSAQRERVYREWDDFFAATLGTWNGQEPCSACASVQFTVRLGFFFNVIRAVICTHIVIKMPSQDKFVYIKRKCFHSITLQEHNQLIWVFGGLYQCMIYLFWPTAWLENRLQGGTVQDKWLLGHLILLNQSPWQALNMCTPEYNSMVVNLLRVVVEAKR